MFAPIRPTPTNPTLVLLIHTSLKPHHESRNPKVDRVVVVNPHNFDETAMGQAWLDHFDEGRVRRLRALCSVEAEIAWT
jgi:hypothetical protein